MKKINIGITLSIDPTESLFTNGIRQNVIILRELYEKCDGVGDCYIINTSGKQLPDDPSLPLHPFRKFIIDLKDVKKYCNFVVVAHGSLLPGEYKELHESGIKIVKLLLGNLFSMFNEQILFKNKDDYYGVFKKNSGFIDKTWVSKHFYRDRYFYETLYDCETKIAPYVWDSRFIEKSNENYKLNHGKSSEYQPSGKKEKHILNFEPNLNMVKVCTQAIVVLERFYKQNPELVGDSYFFNTSMIKEKKDFIDFVKDLKVYKSGRASFEGGIAIINALGKYGDIVLATQNQNELNYLYLDAAWMGYPVVHNSSMMKEIGYYYEENNAQQASETLLQICQGFDGYYEKYKEESRQKASKYMITNEENIKECTKLIHEVVEGKWSAKLHI